MKNLTLFDGIMFPPIPSLCLCGCGETVWGGRRYIKGHQNIGRSRPDSSKRMKENNPTKNKEVVNKISNSLNLGFKNGRSVWNKGIEWREMCGNNNPMKRPEIIEKFLGKSNPMYGRPSPMLGKTHTKETIEQMTGENNHNWKGGKSFESYPREFKNIREYIRSRDNNTCQMCRKSTEQEGRRMCVHHINHNKKDCRRLNLITLCRSCNCKAESKIMKTNYESFLVRRIGEIEHG